ncbi:hypothetical protein BJV78DRAFT_111368 [Lactifluus subvellereus]|nr:hypothetical protein BJV78DRAFT_111368 [Lactifluus subvellereus]
MKSSRRSEGATPSVPAPHTSARPHARHSPSQRALGSVIGPRARSSHRRVSDSLKWTTWSRYLRAGGEEFQVEHHVAAGYLNGQRAIVALFCTTRGNQSLSRLSPSDTLLTRLLL